MRPERRRPLARLALFLTLLLAPAACAPLVIEPGPADRRPWLVDDQAALMADGARLPLRAWRPPGETTAAVVALHGFGDYSNAFAEFGPTLAEAGVAVFAADQRGFGRAGGSGAHAAPAGCGAAARAAQPDHRGAGA